MISFLLLLIAFAVGCLSPIQSAVNNRLSHQLNSSYLSGAISNLIGGSIMFFIALYKHSKSPIIFASLTIKDWWLFSGGIFSAIIVLTSILLPTKIGYASYISTFLCGQLIIALLIDTLGWFGASVIPLTGKDFLGIILLCLGVILLKK